MAIRIEPFVVGGAKANQNFVVPGPDSVISGPAAVTSGFRIDCDVLDDVRRFGREGSTGTDRDQKESHHYRTHSFSKTKQPGPTNDTIPACDGLSLRPACCW